MQPGVFDESASSGGRVHVIGAGPVGLMLTALLQSMDRFALLDKLRIY